LQTYNAPWSGRGVSRVTLSPYSMSSTNGDRLRAGMNTGVNRMMAGGTSIKNPMARMMMSSTKPIG